MHKNATLLSEAPDRDIKPKFQRGRNEMETTTGLKADDYFICIYIGHTLPIMIDVMSSNMEL